MSSTKIHGGAYSVWLLVVLAALAALALGMPPAMADSNDDAYLAALHHGGLCCQEQADMPISYADPSSEISDGHWIANTMKESDTTVTGNETHVAFEGLRTTIYKNSNSPGHLHPLNTFQSGELIVIAVHYYAGPAVECALMKDMGGAMGEAPYWYGPVTYSGGLAVQPDCIKSSS
jgi:hypothetical protein